MSKFYRTTKADFQDWLQQHTWISHSEKAPRKVYIPELYHSLTQFMKKKGYIMDYRWNKGPMIVARWLYAIHIHEVARKCSTKPIGYPDIIHRNWEEDNDVFDLHLDIQAIEQFMKSWQTVEDMNIETRHGFRTQVELPTLLYTYVDMDYSPQGMKLARLLEPTDSEGGGSEKEEFEDLMGGAFGTTKKIIGYNTL
jgi:hypothetical protein